MSNDSNKQSLNQQNKVSDLLFIKLQKQGWEDSKLHNYINKLPQNYWKMFDLNKMITQANLFKNMISTKRKYAFDLSQHANSNVSELVVIAPDNFGLFSKILGIVSLYVILILYQ